MQHFLPQEGALPVHLNTWRSPTTFPFCTKYCPCTHKNATKKLGYWIQLTHSTYSSPPLVNCSRFHTFSRLFTPLLWTSEHLFHSYTQYNWTSSGLFLAWERAVGFGENTQCLPKTPDYIFLYFTPYSVPPFGRGDWAWECFCWRKERGNFNLSLSFI